jgi:hypothetical protein
VEPICNCIFYFLAKEGYTKISNYSTGMNRMELKTNVMSTKIVKQKKTQILPSV